MTPTQKGFTTNYLVILEINDGLIIKLKTFTHERFAQVEFDCSSILQAGVHAGLEESIFASSFSFGSIHGQIGVSQKLVGVGAIVRNHGNADTGIDDEKMTLR